MDLDQIKKEFDKYTNLFDMNNCDVKYKYNHSYRVMKLSNMIAKNLKLSKEDIMLATVIGLLHDIGRFKQLKMFDSYDDKNIDHADLGVKILFEEGLIHNLKIESKYYDIIKFAIVNHNKLNIEKTDNEKENMHAKIIRDADKIDILKAHVIYNDYKEIETDEKISEPVRNSFYNNNAIKKKDLKNRNDRIILLLAFIFDINYDINIKYIEKERIIQKFYEMIKNKSIFDEYFKYTFNYINERVILC